VGVAHPVILLPASLLTGCSVSQLRLMLAHEIIHLRRRDLLWGGLPALAQRLFWFHPLAWLAGGEWHLAQELACDEEVVRITRTRPGDYGEVLVKVAAQAFTRAAGGWMAAGVLESSQTLQRRLIAMKSLGSFSRKRVGWIGALLAIIGVMLLVPWQVTAQTGGNTGVANGRSEEVQREAQMRLKQLGLALNMYAQDYDGLLPPMGSPAAVKQLLSPYVQKNDLVFLDPWTSQPYLPNPSLSGKRLIATTTHPADIARPEEVIGFYQPAPAASGGRNLLFLDGHVQRISEAEWQRLKQSSHIR
jgi:prepilin-type processing-associated H-X9-DG protein